MSAEPPRSGPPDRAASAAACPPATVRIILAEHVALSAVLRTLPLLMQQYRRDDAGPDFTTLRAMLFYVDEFPERRHHRDESDILFPKLRARSPPARHLLDQLDADHAYGESRIRSLEHLLLGYEMMGRARSEPFEAALGQYVGFYLNHMATEERCILPLAMQVLSEQDWEELDLRFTTHRDPLAGCGTPDPDYEALFGRILRLVPAPLGVGAAPATG